jgi:hypothetical protein
MDILLFGVGSSTRVANMVTLIPISIAPSIDSCFRPDLVRLLQ